MWLTLEIIRMLAKRRLMIACQIRIIKEKIHAITVGCAALVVVSLLQRIIITQITHPVKRAVASITLTLTKIVKGTTVLSVVGLVAGDVNLMERHDFSVRIQVSTGTLLRENTYRTKVPSLCLDFIGAQSISYL
jgi:hypothetical protein